MKTYSVQAYYTSKGKQRVQNIPSKTIKFDVTGEHGIPEGTVVQAAAQDGVFKDVNCLSGFLSNVFKIRLVVGAGLEGWVCLAWESKDGDFDAELCGEMTSFNMELAYTNGLMRDCVKAAAVCHA